MDYFQNLKQYLKKSNLSERDFAKIINCDAGYFNKILNGKRPLGIKLAKCIEIASKGTVKAENLLREQFECNLKKRLEK